MFSTKPKCQFCMPKETWCFIFGVFSCIISGVVILLPRFIYMFEDMRRIQLDLYDEIKFVIYIVSRDLISIVVFIFSVFLCYGLHKRRSGFVKAYLIYGIVITVLVMLAAIAYSWLAADIVVGSVMLMGCGVYSLLLQMVHRTYEMFRDEKTHDQQQPIDSKPILIA